MICKRQTFNCLLNVKGAIKVDILFEFLQEGRVKLLLFAIDADYSVRKSYTYI